jgi:hypothetical protein
MTGFPLEWLTETRLYRLLRTVVLALAAGYVAMCLVNAIYYTGDGPDAVFFTLRTLKADVFDVLSTINYKLFNSGLGAGSRPTRYALLCQEIGQSTEMDNAAAELQVRRQLVDNKSGDLYNAMSAAIKDGEAQPVFILSKLARGGATFCATTYYRSQECTCRGKYKATERSRIPARELFGPLKPL